MIKIYIGDRPTVLLGISVYSLPQRDSFYISFLTVGFKKKENNAYAGDFHSVCLTVLVHLFVLYLCVCRKGTFKYLPVHHNLPFVRITFVYKEMRCMWCLRLIIPVKICSMYRDLARGGTCRVEDSKNTSTAAVRGHGHVLKKFSVNVYSNSWIWFITLFNCPVDTREDEASWSGIQTVDG